MHSVLILVTQVSHFGKFMYDMSHLFLNGDFLSSSEFLLAIFRTDSIVKHSFVASLDSQLIYLNQVFIFWGIQLESMCGENTVFVGLRSITS